MARSLVLLLALAGAPVQLRAQRLPDSVRAQIHGLDSAAAAARAGGSLGQESTALRQVADLFAGSGRTDSALARFRLALAVVRRRTDEYWLAGDERQILVRIGELQQILGRADSAIVAYRRALLPVDSLLDGLPPSWNDVLSRVKDDPALRYAVAAYLEESGIILQHLGGALRMARASDSARAAFRLAFLRFQRGKQVDSAVGSIPEVTCVPVKGDLFDAWRKMRLFSLEDDPLPILHGDLRTQQMFGSFLLECRTLVAIGDYYRDRARLDSARAYFVRADRIVRDVGDSTGMATIASRLTGHGPTARAGVAEGAAAHIALLSRLGDSLHASGTEADLRRAVACYDSAAAEVADLMVHTADEALRVRFAETLTGLTERSVLAWLSRAPSMGRDTSAYGALASADRFRAWSLLLRRGTSMFTEAVPEGERLPESGRLAAALALGGGFSMTGLYYQVATDTLLVWLLRPDSNVVILARVPVADAKLSGLVARTRVAIAGRSTNEPLQRMVDDRERGVRAIGAGDPDSLLAALAELVLPPEIRAALADSSEVVVFPQGVLAAVPFAALPMGSSGERLGYRHPVRYGTSLRLVQAVDMDGRGERMPLVADTVTVMRELMSRQGLLADRRRYAAQNDSLRRWLARALAAGDPVMPAWGDSGRKQPLPPLPGARRETGAVAALLGVQPLIGAAASEAAIRPRLSRATVVHLASHGLAFATDDRVDQSFVALAPGAGEDGLLTVGELLADEQIRLVADLVVISACQSGLGAPLRAEGILGLQRAFLAKGARSVMVSLWNVSDQATALLMLRFYAHWIGSRGYRTKAEALRMAQEDVRKTPGFESPRFWAAFQLVGAR